MKRKKKITPIWIFLILVFFLGGCGESKNKTGDVKENLDSTEVKKSMPQKTFKKTKEPFYKNESLVALELRALDRTAKYDADAPVILRVELFSPRSFAVLDHNRYKTPNEETAELPVAKVGQAEKPWWRELKLTVSGNGMNGEVPFHVDPSVMQGTVDLGNGDVGSVKLILEEGTFPLAGEYQIKAYWNGGKHGQVSSEKLPVVLVKDHLKKTDRELLKLKVMLARKENDAALELGKKLAEANPASYRIRFILGEAYEKNNNFNEALTQYRQALILFHQGKS